MTPRRPLSQLVAHDVLPDPEIVGVTADSRKVEPGFLFAALPGVKVDGRAFIAMALEKGASAILAAEDTPDLPVPVIRVDDPRRAFALAAARFWGAQPQTVVAVTGTNGKTSVATSMPASGENRPVSARWACSWRTRT